MSNRWFLVRLIFSVIASVLLSSGLLAAEKRPITVANFVAGLPDPYVCTVSDSSAVKRKCPAFEVQVFEISDPDGAVQGCVAALPYNSLNFHTGPNADAGSIVWILKKPGAVFTGAGMTMAVTSGQAFDPPMPLVDGTQTVVVLVTTKGQKKSYQYNQTPTVSYTLPKTGTVVPCTGIDPVISNTAN